MECTEKKHGESTENGLFQCHLSGLFSVNSSVISVVNLSR